MTEATLMAEFMSNAEGQARFPSTTDNDAAVTVIFNNVLGRAPASQTGIDFYAAKLATITKAEVAAEILATAKSAAGDSTYISGKVAEAQTTYDAAAGGSTPPAIDGETFTLTTSVDTIEGTANNDLITGTTSSLSSEKTLTSTDIIDGGEGSDIAQVTMKAAFTGFTGTGKMENVETVELTNDSTIDRNFDATGVSGVEKYVIDATKADVTLSDLNAAGIEIDYSGAKAGNIDVAFDAAFVSEPTQKIGQKKRLKPKP